MSNIRKSLERLEELAAQLNTETDEINELILGVEEKLRKLNLGQEVWLRDANARPIFLVTYRTTFGKPVGWQLGFSKLGDTWRIAIRRMENEGPKSLQYRVLEGESPKPALDSSRDLRVAACQQLSLLVDQLAGRVEAALQEVVAAKAAVKP